MSGKTWISRFLRFAVVGSVFFFSGRNVYRNWEEVQQYEWHFEYPILIMSFFAFLATLSLMVIFWRSIVFESGFIWVRRRHGACGSRPGSWFVSDVP